MTEAASKLRDSGQYLPKQRSSSVIKVDGIVDFSLDGELGYPQETCSFFSKYAEISSIAPKARGTHGGKVAYYAWNAVVRRIVGAGVDLLRRV